MVSDGGTSGGVTRVMERPAVLVVEDDPLQRRVVGRLLGLWGYATIEAADGLAAIDRFEEHRGRVRLIVLDIMLPGVDGIEVARRVRDEEPALPIVACSAGFTEPVEGALRDLGGIDLLPKPFDAQSLRRAVDRRVGCDG